MKARHTRPSGVSCHRRRNLFNNYFLRRNQTDSGNLCSASERRRGTGSRSFLTDFLDSAAESAMVPAHFLSLWGEMLDFASTSAAWTKGLGRSSQGDERLWRRLLAVDPRFGVLWQKHFPALRLLWPKIFGLMEARLRGGESLPELCYFFKQPFAAGFLSDGLLFMERLCTTNPDDVFDSYELENSFAYFLLDVGQRQPINKHLTDQAAQAYRALVTLLATRQNAIAMQMQREHGRASS